MTKRLVGEIGGLHIYTDDGSLEDYWHFGADEVAEYGGLSCWIEEDNPPTAQQLVDGLARSAMMWGGTPSGCRGALRFYAGQAGRYKKLLLERLGADSSA